VSLQNKLITIMTTTQEAIDLFLESKQGNGFRTHLGASIVGKPCARELWYSFRWAKKNFHQGRILRLFQRGHEEEDRISQYLRRAGVHVVQEDPKTGEQYRIIDHDEHFGGSLDALLFDAYEYPEQWILGEYKTHSDKSFKRTKNLGVEKAKWEHFVQMQIYMHYKELPAALYIAVNKNDDDLYMPIVEYDEEVALRYIDRAHFIIYSPDTPERVKNASPGWYTCRFCDYTDICHHGAEKEKHCRTCLHCDPIEDGAWLCQKYNYTLSTEEQKNGCADYTVLVDTP
jgi:hypothetical protein